MIANVVNNRLTLSPLVAILSALSPSLAVRVSSREKQEMPIQARLFRRLRYSMQEIIYGGRYLGSESSHGSLAMSTNPHNVHRPKFSSFKRCPLTFKRDLTMSQNNSAPKKSLTVNFSHLLVDKDDDLSNILDLNNNVSIMTTRATSILQMLASGFCEAKYRQDDEAIYFTIMAAINEIKSIDAIVDAYTSNLMNETRGINTALDAFAKRQV